MRTPFLIISKRFQIVILAFLPFLLGGLAFFLSPRGADLALEEAQARLPYPFAATLKGPAKEDNSFLRLEEKLRRTPGSALDWAELAGLYVKKAKASGGTEWLGKAEAAAEKSWELLPYWNDGALLTLARVAEYRHDFPKALGLAGKILADRPNHPEVMSLLITTYLAQGRDADAEKIADTLVKNYPTLPALTLRALCREKMGKTPAAWQDYLNALRAEDVGDPAASAWLRSLMGRFLTRQGERELAEEFFSEALRIQPAYPLARASLGSLSSSNSFADSPP